MARAPARAACRVAGAVAHAAGVLTRLQQEAALERLLDERARDDGGALSFLGGAACAWQVPARVRLEAARFAALAVPADVALRLADTVAQAVAALLCMPGARLGAGDASGALAAVLAALTGGTGAGIVAVSAALDAGETRALSTRLVAAGLRPAALAFDTASGATDPEVLADAAAAAQAVVVAQPNAFGVIEDLPALARATHGAGAALVVRADPLLHALLRGPGACGADAACGPLQPCGLAPGTQACFVAGSRELAGALDPLTAPPWDDCLRALLHLDALGEAGLAGAVARARDTAGALRERLEALDGVTRAFTGPVLNTFALRLPGSAAEFVRALAAHNLVAGCAAPVAGEDCLVVSTSDLHGGADLDRYAALMERVLRARGGPRCPVRPKL